MSDAISAASAIACALRQEWAEAIRLNKAILKKDKHDIDAMNRLGFAYLKSGDIKQAKDIFSHVISLDQYNTVARKHLTSLENGSHKQSSTVNISYAPPSSFVQDPGRTKILTCINLAPIAVLRLVQSGQRVFLKSRKRCIEVRDEHDTYIAALPDDVSFRMGTYVTAGNTYEASIKTISKTTLTIFVREVARGKAFEGQPSFLGSTSTPLAKKPRKRRKRS